jgi:hypothetical protein
MEMSKTAHATKHGVTVYSETLVIHHSFPPGMRLEPNHPTVAHWESVPGESPYDKMLRYHRKFPGMPIADRTLTQYVVGTKVTRSGRVLQVGGVHQTGMLFRLDQALPNSQEMARRATIWGEVPEEPEAELTQEEEWLLGSSTGRTSNPGELKQERIKYQMRAHEAEFTKERLEHEDFILEVEGELKGIRELETGTNGGEEREALSTGEALWLLEKVFGPALTISLMLKLHRETQSEREDCPCCRWMPMKPTGSKAYDMNINRRGWELLLFHLGWVRDEMEEDAEIVDSHNRHVMAREDLELDRLRREGVELTKQELFERRPEQLPRWHMLFYMIEETPVKRFIRGKKHPIEEKLVRLTLNGTTIITQRKGAQWVKDALINDIFRRLEATLANNSLDKEWCYTSRWQAGTGEPVVLDRAVQNDIDFTREEQYLQPGEIDPETKKLDFHYLLQDAIKNPLQLFDLFYRGGEKIRRFDDTIRIAKQGEHRAWGDWHHYLAKCRHTKAKEFEQAAWQLLTMSRGDVKNTINSFWRRYNASVKQARPNFSSEQDEQGKWHNPPLVGVVAVTEIRRRGVGTLAGRKARKDIKFQKGPTWHKIWLERIQMEALQKVADWRLKEHPLIGVPLPPKEDTPAKHYNGPRGKVITLGGKLENKKLFKLRGEWTLEEALRVSEKI